MPSPFARLHALAAQLGRWNAVLYLLSRALEAGTRGKARIVKYYIVAQPIRSSAPTRSDASTSVQMVSRGDPLTSSFPRPTEVIARRYSNGAQCLAAVVREAFAGYLWWQHERYEEDEVRCTYVLLDKESCVWDYDVYVEPRFRLGRTLSRLWQRANDELCGRGVRWTFSRISAFNPASLASHARLGMQARQSATFWVLGPLQISCMNMPPYLHVSLSDRQRPTLKLSAPADSS